MALSRVRGMGDVRRILEEAEGRLRKGGPKGILGDLLLTVAMLREALSGRYRLSNRTIFALAAALLYFLVPTDAIMDFLPIVGYVDDAAVLTYVLKSLADEVERFKATVRE